MSEQPDETSETSETVSIELWPADGSKKALRQIGYGMTPFVLIEPEYDEDEDQLTWNIIGSHVDELDELVEFMDAAMGVVRLAVEQNAAQPHPPVTEAEGVAGT